MLYRILIAFCPNRYYHISLHYFPAIICSYNHLNAVVVVALLVTVEGSIHYGTVAMFDVLLI